MDALRDFWRNLMWLLITLNFSSKRMVGYIHMILANFWRYRAERIPHQMEVPWCSYSCIRNHRSWPLQKWKLNLLEHRVAGADSSRVDRCRSRCFSIVKHPAYKFLKSGEEVSNYTERGVFKKIPQSRFERHCFPCDVFQIVLSQKV